MTTSYLYFCSFKCSLKIESKLFTHSWTWRRSDTWAFSFQTGVSNLHLIRGHLPAVRFRSFCLSPSPFKQPFLHSQLSVETLGLSCILCCPASLPSFLSCRHWEYFLSNPHSCCCSLSQPWPLPLSLSSLCFPWGSVAVLLYCWKPGCGGIEFNVFSFWFWASALFSQCLLKSPHSFFSFAFLTAALWHMEIPRLIPRLNQTCSCQPTLAAPDP